MTYMPKWMFESPTKEWALKVLDDAPRGSAKSAINPALTKEQVYQVVYQYVLTMKPKEVMNKLMYKRVLQMVLNQKRPRMDKGRD